MATTWSTTNKNTHITLSNGNLTATADATLDINFPGRSDTSFGTGIKRYWEQHVDQVSLDNPASGVCNSTFTFGDNNFLGLDANGVGYYDDGSVVLNNVVVATLATFAAGDTISLACNSHNKIWFRKNGGGWNNDVL